MFGIQTGVAISFLVKKRGSKGARIFYARRPEMATAEEKLSFLSGARLHELESVDIKPDQRNQWFGVTSNDFDTLIPVATKASKQAKTPAQEKAIFKLFSLGVVTARDDWTYSFDKLTLTKLARYQVEKYNDAVVRCGGQLQDKVLIDSLGASIKWTRSLKRNLLARKKFEFDPEAIVLANYRPFVARWMYFKPELNEMQNLMPRVFPNAAANNIAAKPGTATNGDRSLGQPLMGRSLGPKPGEAWDSHRSLAPKPGRSLGQPPKPGTEAWDRSLGPKPGTATNGGLSLGPRPRKAWQSLGQPQSLGLQSLGQPLKRGARSLGTPGPGTEASAKPAKPGTATKARRAKPGNAGAWYSN